MHQLVLFSVIYTRIFFMSTDHNLLVCVKSYPDKLEHVNKGERCPSWSKSNKIPGLRGPLAHVNEYDDNFGNIMQNKTNQAFDFITQVIRSY